MDELPGNTNKAKEKKIAKETKKVEKVVSSEVTTKKKGVGHRFKSIFFGGDFKNAISFVAADVLLPSLRNMVADATKGAVDRVLYGESHYQRSRHPEYRTRVNYQNPISRSRTDPRDPRERIYLPDQPPRPFRQGRHEVDDIIIVDRQEAELVVERLIDIVNQYDVASLADLYDLVGIPSTHVDNKWGWTLLTSAEVVQVRDGYMLRLPPLEEI